VWPRSVRSGLFSGYDDTSTVPAPVVTKKSLPELFHAISLTS
jgi:hypothetical protein